MKPETETLTLEMDGETARKLERAAGEMGMTPGEFIAMAARAKLYGIPEDDLDYAVWDLCRQAMEAKRRGCFAYVHAQGAVVTLLSVLAERDAKLAPAVDLFDNVAPNDEGKDPLIRESYPFTPTACPPREVANRFISAVIHLVYTAWEGAGALFHCTHALADGGGHTCTARKLDAGERAQAFYSLGLLHGAACRALDAAESKVICSGAGAALGE